MSVQHEITTTARWISDEYSYNHYTINAAPFPNVSGEIRRDYQYLTGSYSYFLSPIAHDAHIPAALERFYTHPSSLRISASFQPEHESRHVFENVQQDFFRTTHTTRRFRQIGMNVEYYFWDNTGLLAAVNSAKYEDAERLSDTLGRRQRGEHEEIRYSYTIGFSRYVTPDLRIRGTCTIRDFEYLAHEKELDREISLHNISSREEAETDGYALSARVEYVLNARWTFSGGYTLSDRERQSDLFSPYYHQLPDSTLSYHDDRLTHTVQTHFTRYLTGAATLYAGWQFDWNQQERTYSTEQRVEHDWETTTLTTGVSYEISPRFEVHAAYEFSQEHGDVLSKSKGKRRDSRTAYQTRSAVHGVTCGITGRF